MDQVIEALSLEDTVLYSSYNGVIESTDRCIAETDHDDYSGNAKCPWLDTNYFQGLSLFESVYGPYSDATDFLETSHGRVRVAVIEADKTRKGGEKIVFIYLTKVYLT